MIFAPANGNESYVAGNAIARDAIDPFFSRQRDGVLERTWEIRVVALDS